MLGLKIFTIKREGIMPKESTVPKSTITCGLCCVTIALAEDTTASGKFHLECAVKQAAAGLIKLGMALNPTSSPKELLRQLTRLLKEAIEQEPEKSGDVIQAIQETSNWIFGQPIELDHIMAARE